jgi:hypothetical protein
LLKFASADRVATSLPGPNLRELILVPAPTSVAASYRVPTLCLPVLPVLGRLVRKQFR